MRRGDCCWGRRPGEARRVAASPVPLQLGLETDRERTMCSAWASHMCSESGRKPADTAGALSSVLLWTGSGHASASCLSAGARWHLCSPDPLGEAAGPVRCVSAARTQLRKQQAVNKCRCPPGTAGAHTSLWDGRQRRTEQMPVQGGFLFVSSEASRSKTKESKVRLFPQLVCPENWLETFSSNKFP